MALESLEPLRADTHPIDVLISDIGISELDGYRLIRAQFRLGADHLKAIAVTAFTRAFHGYEGAVDS